MSGSGNGATRRLVAIILGLLGVTVLIDIVILVAVVEDADLSGARQLLLVIIGALLLLGGVVTFSWPRRGSVESAD